MELNTENKPETEEQIIKYFNIILDNPPQNKIEDLDQNLILIRHGFSQGQLEADYLHKKYNGQKPNTDPEFFEVRTGTKFIDTPLHEIGIQQAINSQKYINNIEFDIVLVSPLKRALQTCYYMFKTHPQKNNIRFIVLPGLQEILNQTQCLASSYIQLIQEFQQLPDSVNFDFSIIQNMEHQGLLWQLDQIIGREQQIKQIKEKILNEIGNQQVAQENFTQLHQDIYQKNMHIAIQKHFEKQDILEDWPMVYNRVTKYVKPFVKNIIDKEKPKNKIGIVAHFVTLKVFTKENMEDVGQSYTNSSINYYSFK